MSFVENNGKIIYIKAFSVNNILSNKVGRQNINIYTEDIPHLDQEYLQEAIKPLPKTYLDLLVRIIHLELQPACGHGFGYPDYTKGYCIKKLQFAC